MTETTVIRDAAWVVAWDKSSGAHCYRRDVDLAFSGGTITFLGKRYSGSSEREIDGRDLMVMPGLINVHTHAGWEPVRKGMTDEIRSPGFWHSSLYEYLPLFPLESHETAVCMRVAYAEMLKSGCTTIVDFGFPFDGWLDLMGESGLRVVAAPWFFDASYSTKDGHSVAYVWDKAEGRRQFEASLKAIDLANQHPSGRLSGLVAPGQIDCATSERLRDAFDVAEERNLPYQLHTAESVVEFHEMQRRHGLTSVGWLEKLGILGERTTLGHAIFLDHHPWLHWTSRRDLGLLADRGVSVAHCPTVFMRRGIALNTFGAYVKAGINMGIGTDTYPHNMLDEMRHAGTVARAVAGTVDDLDTSDVFNAATIGGAKALMREDIGRLTVGARADLVLVDLEHPAMMPVREPIRNLIFVANDRAVRDVFVDGRQVVRDGEVQTIDHRAACEELAEVQARAIADIPGRDWAGRDADTLMPRVFPVMN